MANPSRKLLLSTILIIMGASILMRDGGAVSLRGRELEMECPCKPCGTPCGNPSPLPPSPPVLMPPPLPPAPPLLPPYLPAGPPPPFCPPTPEQPYIPAPPYWIGPPGMLYPVDVGYHPNGAGRRSTEWLPVLVSCGLLALWL